MLYFGDTDVIFISFAMSVSGLILSCYTYLLCAVVPVLVHHDKSHEAHMGLWLSFY